MTKDDLLILIQIHAESLKRLYITIDSSEKKNIENELKEIKNRIKHADIMHLFNNNVFVVIPVFEENTYTKDRAILLPGGYLIQEKFKQSDGAISFKYLLKYGNNAKITIEGSLNLITGTIRFLEEEHQKLISAIQRNEESEKAVR